MGGMKLRVTAKTVVGSESVRWAIAKTVVKGNESVSDS